MGQSEKMSLEIRNEKRWGGGEGIGRVRLKGRRLFHRLVESLNKINGPRTLVWN